MDSAVPTRQPSLTEATNDRPQTGFPLDQRTHYAHVRYAAKEIPGIIWFDPRDGRERLTLDTDTSLSALDEDEQVLTSIELRGHRNVCGVVEPSQKWMLLINYAVRAEYQIVGWRDETVDRVESHCETHIFETQAAARVAAEEQVEEYAAADYRNAVEYRTGSQEAMDDSNDEVEY